MQKEDPEVRRCLDEAERGKRIPAMPEVDCGACGVDPLRTGACGVEPPGPFDDSEPMPEVELHGPASASEVMRLELLRAEVTKWKMRCLRAIEGTLVCEACGGALETEGEKLAFQCEECCPK